MKQSEKHPWKSRLHVKTKPDTVKAKKKPQVIIIESLDKDVEKRVSDMLENALLVGKLLKVIMYVEVKDELHS
jgi:hypothetical protein